MDVDLCCSVEPVNQLEDPFDERERDVYLELFFAGLITRRQLDQHYHNRVSEMLFSPVRKHIGDPGALEEGVRRDMSRAMRRNVFEFSAAKQYQQARALSSIIDDQIDFTTFKGAATVVFDEFNNNFLRTEFETAVTATQNANTFIDAVETVDDFPLVRYFTQQDTRVRPAHQSLQGVTLPVTDPFWRRYWPPNGWNCRCFVVKLEEGQRTDINNVDLQDVRDNTPELFRQNPAISGQLFDKKKHPYWRVARGDSGFRDNNFGLDNGELTQ